MVFNVCSTEILNIMPIFKEINGCFENWMDCFIGGTLLGARGSIFHS